ncbi:phage protein Gp36 family protein [Sporomusa sp. KB1]|uniref:phage protein Gp36 family protein n=1 Tax=Sporomusa sp. KB1 TaxID=943346 RepID=UPI0011ADDBE4|nr:phage protein Gp36 family protein [Sporomusa sp. KB1]TWH45900.1 uncharacterized protein DUF1320 [Sporomusa sp. KB1]
MAYTTAELVLGKSRLDNEPDFDVSQAIADAQARIDTKLRKRYKVPFTDPVPPIICSIATCFAAGFAIEKDYSNRAEKNEPYLAEVLIKRAEADLQDILDNALLDGMEGVAYAPPPPVEPAELARPAMRTTTPRPSEMEKVLGRW